MKLSTATLCLVVSSFFSSAWGSEIIVKNPGFEESAKGPVSWMTPQHAGVRAYEMAIDEKKFAEGKRSFRMKRIAQQAYGIVSQDVAAPQSEGKLLKVSAALSTEKVGPGGWLLVVNFKAKSGRIIEQARSTKVTGDTDWKRVVLEKKIPAGTDQLYIGVMLLDSGTGWADDVKIQLKDK